MKRNPKKQLIAFLEGLKFAPEQIRDLLLNPPMHFKNMGDQYAKLSAAGWDVMKNRIKAEDEEAFKKIEEMEESV